MAENNNKPNYIGSTWYNEYEGKFSGYTLYLTRAQLEECLEKYMDPERDTVRLNIRKGSDFNKPYTTVTDPSAAKPVSKEKRAAAQEAQAE